MLLLIMSGNPATGKTFLSRHIYSCMSPLTKVKLITSLQIRERLGVFDLYSEKERNLVYKSLADFAKKIIETNSFDILIIDGNFNKEKRRRLFYRITHNTDIYVLECVVNRDELIVDRLKQREKNNEILENRASSKELFELIKNTSNPIIHDQQVQAGRVGLLQYNSENNRMTVIKNKSNFAYAKSQVLLENTLLAIKNYETITP